MPTSILDPVSVLWDESLEVEEVGDLFIIVRVMLTQSLRQTGKDLVQTLSSKHLAVL